MGEFIWNLIFLYVPWWVWLALALVVAAALVYLQKRIGLTRVLAIIAIMAVGVISARSAQKGWEARAKKDMDDANKALDRAADARLKSEKLNADPKNLRTDDGHRRRD